MRSMLRLKTAFLVVIALVLTLPVTIYAAQDEATWADYSEAMHSELVGASSKLPGLYFTDDYDFGRCHTTSLPESIYSHIRNSDVLYSLDYDVQNFIARDIASSWIHLPLQGETFCSGFLVDFTAELGPTYAGTGMILFESKERASTTFAEVTSGLARTGWQIQNVKGVDHDHTCATLVIQAPSLYMTPTLAICGVSRDDTILIGANMLPVEAPEAALQNAVDLAQLMNKAYDQVGRP